MSRLLEFIIESNRIESIFSEERAEAEVPAYQKFLAEKTLNYEALLDLLKVIAPTFEYRGYLYENGVRDKEGMNVSVGVHRPPPGGPEVETALVNLLAKIREGLLTPYMAHIEYETLHPFMDGNGRTGRAVWLYQMQRKQRASAGFLHEWYYQSLQGAR